MARYRRTIEDALKDMQGQSRTTAGLTLSVPELQELGTEYLGANSVTSDQLAENAVQQEHLDVLLQNNLSNLNAAMAQLGTSMEEVQQDAIVREEALEQVREDLVDLDTSLTEIDTSFWPLQNTVTELTGTVGGVANTVTDLQETSFSHEENIGDLLTDMFNAKQDLVTIDDNLAQARIELTDVTTQLSNVTAEVSLVEGKISDAINDSLAIPITEDRLPVGEWSIWPFVQNTIPAGALAPGAIGETDIQDFSLVVKKFKDDRHRIY